MLQIEGPNDFKIHPDFSFRGISNYFLMTFCMIIPEVLQCNVCFGDFGKKKV